jgi:hypothetical protein
MHRTDADDAVPAAETEDDSDFACYANLVCPECGAVVSEGHREGCSLAADAAGDA